MELVRAMPHVSSQDGTMIAYERSGAGPAVILVDGALAYRDHRGSRPLASELSTHFTVVTYDRRGRGESTDTLPYAVEREIEDIEALINLVGAPVFLYGFSSGAVLALRAAAALRATVAKLVVLEPPLNPDSPSGKEEFRRFAEHMDRLLAADRRSDAVEFFLQDMVSPDVLQAIKESPEWSLMERVAPTLAYDNAVMGDGSVPPEAAHVLAPTLVLVGGQSADFKHAAADALVATIPRSERRTLNGYSTLVPPDVLAPVLRPFLDRSADHTAA
jgi:pimeloyl-ACP methyl ester carboxylesterase